MLGRVWKVYGPLAGGQLRRMSRADGTPWHRIAGHLPGDRVRNVAIPPEAIRDYFAAVAGAEAAEFRGYFAERAAEPAAVA